MGQDLGEKEKAPPTDGLQGLAVLSEEDEVKEKDGTQQGEPQLGLSVLTLRHLFPAIQKGDLKIERCEFGSESLGP